MKKKALFGAIILAITLVMGSVRADEEFIVVVVKEGDTLWAIAKEYLKDPTRWPEILKYNDIEDPNLIRPGMRLKIPNSLLKKQPPPEPAPAPSPSPQPSPAPAPAPTPTPAPASGKAAEAVVVHVKGEVMRIPARGTPEQLRVKALLVGGDRLTTDISSFISLSLPAGAAMMVGSDTHLEALAIEESGGAPGGRLAVKLEQGMVRVQTGKRGLSLEIKIGSVLVTAADAYLQIRSEDGVAQYIEVYSGSAVAKSRNSSVTIPANKGLLVTGDSLSSPKSLPPPPVLRAYSYESDDGPRGGVMWSHPENVGSYRLEIAGDEKFITTVYIAGYAGTTLDFAFFNQFPPGDYAFRLIAVSADGLWGIPSDAMVFQQ